MTDQCMWLVRDDGALRRCSSRKAQDSNGFCDEHLLMPDHDRFCSQVAIGASDFDAGQLLRAIRSTEADCGNFIDSGQIGVLVEVTFADSPDAKLEDRGWDPAMETYESLVDSANDPEHFEYLLDRRNDPFHNVSPVMHVKYINPETDKEIVAAFTDTCSSFEEVSQVDIYEGQELSRLSNPFELLARQADPLNDE